MSHEISSDAAPGCLLFFGLSVAGGKLIARILRQGHLLDIPENVQSFVEQNQMQKQLIIIKNDNVVLTKTSPVIFLLVRQCGNLHCSLVLLV